MKVRIYIAVLLSLLGMSVGYAQSLSVDDSKLRWEGGGNVGLNNDGFEFDFRGLFFFNQYVGLKVGIGCASELWTMEDWTDASDWTQPGYGRRGHDYAIRFRFNPAVSLRTPALFEWRDRDAAFHLFAEPGLILSPGSSGSMDARTLCWDLNAGINMQLGRYVVALGYGISNFSLYSGSPDSYWGQPGKKDYLTHTIFIGFAVKFRMGRSERKSLVPSPYGFDGKLMPTL